MRSRIILVLVFALHGLSSAVVLRATEFEFSPELTQSQFDAFASLAADAIYVSPLAPAEGLGVTGFEVYAALSGTSVEESSAMWRHSATGGVYGGYWGLPRLGVRKGLPWGVDLGATYGTTLGGSVEWAGAEVKWAFLRGGNLKPAAALRITYSQLLASHPLDLRTAGIEVLASKGFTILTPYAGAGVQFSTAEITDSGPASRLDVSDEVHGFWVVGARLNLWIPELSAEWRGGERNIFAVKLAFGF